MGARAAGDGEVAKNDGIMVVHAEDDDLVQFNYEKFAAEGRTEGTLRPARTAPADRCSTAARVEPSVLNTIRRPDRFRRTDQASAETAPDKSAPRCAPV